MQKKNRIKFYLNSKKLKNQQNSNNVTNNTINNTTNNIKQMNNQLNNINIKVLAFRKEDLSHIKEDVYKKILNKGFKSVANKLNFI